MTNNSVINFNGDDSIVLLKGSTPIDSIGQIGGYVVWGVDPVTTKDHTLVRKSSVCTGDPDATDAYDPVPEWDGYAQDTFDYLRFSHL